MKHVVFTCLLLVLLQRIALPQSPPTGDVLGVHNLGAGTSPVRGYSSSACLYCHAPHSGQSQGPLWSQTFSTRSYTFYSSDTAQNQGVQPTLGTASTLCLSCHDGTVAVGQMVPYGTMQMSGTMTSTLGTNLESSHPFSLVLPLQDAANLVPSLTSTGTTADPTGSVKLVNGNVECTSCHNAHIQKIDIYSAAFLVRDNRRGGLCLSCHDTSARTVNGIGNPLAQWNDSVHMTSGADLSPSAGLGGYATVADTACLSCHRSHNAGSPRSLLRGAPTPAPTVDATSQSCMSCHNAGDKLVNPILDVFTEFLNSGKKGHPFATAENAHSPTEAVVLDQNRHTTCADCHAPHAAKQVTDFGGTLPPSIRPSQNGVIGVASDGSALSGAATMQYENCLRCHGNSTGKQALPTFGYLPARVAFASDPLNLIPQFGNSATSFHPVMRDRGGASQPSLLSYMWNLNGTTQGRAMGTRIFCTDCHNSDNNREFGGTGPNGPHGSVNTHILERRYEISQVASGAAPGTEIVNRFQNPALDPASGGPYSLCAKCHDLNNVVSNASFNEHSKHIQEEGFSCSVCHSAHGSVTTGGVSGTRLINFDVNVVAPNNGVMSYSNGTCVLVCHGETHGPGM